MIEEPGMYMSNGGEMSRVQEPESGRGQLDRDMGWDRSLGGCKSLGGAGALEGASAERCRQAIFLKCLLILIERNLLMSSIRVLFTKHHLVC